MNREKQTQLASVQYDLCIESAKRDQNKQKQKQAIAEEQKLALGLDSLSQMFLHAVHFVIYPH